MARLSAAGAGSRRRALAGGAARGPLRGSLPAWKLLPLSAAVLHAEPLGWTYKNILLLSGGNNHLADFSLRS